MQCPYCISDVPDEAVVCKHCGRDLYLFKPLLEKIAELELVAARVPVLEAELLALTKSSPCPQALPIHETVPMGVEQRLAWLGFAFLLPLALLLLAHWLIIIRYDLNPIYLRIAALLIPLPFALMFARRWPGGAIAGILTGTTLAVSGVLGMSAITGWVDQLPIWPQNALEWREFAEFSASVAFSFMTGWILGRGVKRISSASGQHASALVVYIAGHLNLGGLTLPEKIERLRELGGKVIAAGTTVVSVYTGLKDFVGL